MKSSLYLTFTLETLHLKSDDKNKIELGDIMTYISNELDTWLDKDYLLE